MKDSDNLFIDSLGKSFSQNDSETFKDYAKYANMIGEAEKPKKIKYVKPNFKVEFSELKRYRDLEDMTMNDWLTVAENGEVINFEEIKDDLKNVKLDLDKISDKKKERFNKHYDSGTIRLPIAILLNGDYYLLGGNTRIAGLLSKGKKPKVWLIKFNNKDEQKEATGTASSGQYPGPLFSKIEATEATTSGSVGAYQTPAMWAKSTKKSDFRGASKTQIPGGKFVTVKKKCKTFPYCNQGDINALNIRETSDSKSRLKETIKSTLHRILNERTINETYKLRFEDKQNIENLMREKYDDYLSDIKKSNNYISTYKNFLTKAKDKFSDEEYAALYDKFGNYLNMDLEQPMPYNKFYNEKYDEIAKDYIDNQEKKNITTFEYKSPKEKKLSKLDFGAYYDGLTLAEKKTIKKFLGVVAERVNSGTGESVNRLEIRNSFFNTPKTFQQMFSEKPSKYLWRGDYAHPCSEEYDHLDKNYLALQSFSQSKYTAKSFGFHFSANNIKSYSGSFSLDLFIKYGDILNFDFGDDEGEVMFFDVVYKCDNPNL